MCTKNYDPIMYGSWDMVCEGRQTHGPTDGRTEKKTYRDGCPTFKSMSMTKFREKLSSHIFEHWINLSPRAVSKKIGIQPFRKTFLKPKFVFCLELYCIHLPANFPLIALFMTVLSILCLIFYVKTWIK